MRSLGRAKKPAGRAAKEPATGRTVRRTKAARPRLEAGRLMSHLKLGGIGLAGLAVAGMVAYGVSAGAPVQIADWGRRAVYDATADMGLAIKEVYVVGRREVARDDLLDALGTGVGASILSVDPDAVRERLESLGWVKSATVRRRLPDTIVLALEERKAVAIWQHEDRFVLIDEDGVTIGDKDVHRHGHLKVVVGPDAPQHVMTLLAILRSEPELEDRVVAAVRMGGRRWNLRLDGGIDVRLPEEGAQDAWHKLANYQREHEILSRAVGAIDLRYPDRTAVQLTEPGLQEVRGRRLGKDT